MKVFVAAAHTDAEYANALDSVLAEAGHIVLRTDCLAANVHVANIRKFLPSSDGLIVLISEASLGNATTLFETGAFFSTMAVDKFVLPVRLDETPLPFDLQHVRFVDGRKASASEVASRVLSVVTEVAVRRDRELEEAKERREVVERTADKYIAESLKGLMARERGYRRWAIICYLLGYGTLVTGLGWAVLRVIKDPPALTDVPQAIFIGIVTLTAIGFLGAASRFAFVMAKSLMVESLRTHDRIHAIKFGEFYLKAFGEQAKWEELKEAFQHWNLDTGSTFKDQKEDSIDPQVLKSLAELLGNLKKS